MPQKDIFNRTQSEVGGVITSDNIKGILSAGGDAWVGVLIQSLSAQYAQQNRPLYELGSNRIYRVFGRPEGTLQISRIVGVNSQLPIEEALFDACRAGGSLTVRTNASTCINGKTGQGGLTLVFGGLYVSTYAFSADANSLLSTENLSLSFNYLSRI